MLVFLYFVMSVVAAVSALFIAEKVIGDDTFNPAVYTYVTFISLLWPLSLPLCFFLLIVQGLYKLIKKMTSKEG